MLEKASKDKVSYSKTSKQAPKTLPDFKATTKSVELTLKPLAVLIR